MATTKVENKVAFENEKSRVDVLLKVSGKADYTVDQVRPNMIHAAFIRFPFGAGKIRSADVEAAEKVPRVMEIQLDTSKTARYLGDRMGRIVAETPEALKDAMGALNLQCDIEGVRSNPEKLYEGVPDLDDDATAALEELYGDSPVVVEATYRTQVQTHSCLEPHSVFADHKGDSAEVWASTQGTFGFLDGVTRPLGLDASKVTVHNEFIGGGFGSKLTPGDEANLAAEVSKKYKRPCRVVFDRREEHLDTGNRPGSIQYMKIAASKDGKLQGGRIHVVSTVGWTNSGGGARNPMSYNFGDIERTEGNISLTSGSPRPFRAPGHPQGCFAVESMMDELAAAIGMDPLEFRKKNAEDKRHHKQLDLGAKLIGWDRRKADGSGSGIFKTGLGCGCGDWSFWDTRTGAEMSVFRSGAVEIRSGVQDIGTGTYTVVTDVAAHELGIPREMITAYLGNSKYPEGVTSGGSMTARSVSPAVMDACANMVDEMRELLAQEWKTTSGYIDFADGEFTLRADGKKASWKDAASLISGQKLTAQGQIKPEYLGEGRSNSTQFAEVEVDTETGIVRVKKIVAIQACGQPVNRLTAENQICGGVIQGISYALFEDRILDRRNGGMVNDDFIMYKIAGSVDIPEIVPVLDWEEGDTGVRSMGEPVTIPTSAAIANAVANATGARVRSLPMMPDKVLQALEEKGGRA